VWPILSRSFTKGRATLPPIDLTAVTDAANLDSVAVGADEEEAVVTNTQPKFFSALESFHVARAGFRKAM
jgi:hypothetical protein